MSAYAFEMNVYSAGVVLNDGCINLGHSVV